MHANQVGPPCGGPSDTAPSRRFRTPCRRVSEFWMPRLAPKRRALAASDPSPPDGSPPGEKPLAPPGDRAGSLFFLALLVLDQVLVPGDFLAFVHQRPILKKYTSDLIDMSIATRTTASLAT